MRNQTFKDPAMDKSLTNTERFIQIVRQQLHKTKTISRVNYLMDIHASHSEMKLLSLLYQVNTPIDSNVTFCLRQS